jgi:hypothetical protein
MIGCAFVVQNVPKYTNFCALFNREVCVHSPEDECCVQQPVFETWTHQNVNDERNCYVILKGHVCVHCFRTWQKKQPLFYAYRLTDFHFQNTTDETRPVLCVPYSTCVYISEWDSRHKRFFVFDGQVCVLIFRMCPKTWIAVLRRLVFIFQNGLKFLIT